MRILFISDVYSVGGAAKALGELVIELKKMGHHPIVCTGRNDEFSVFLDNNDIENFSDNHLGAMDVAKQKEYRKPLWRTYYDEYKNVVRTNKIAIKIIEEKVDINTIDIIHTNSARNDIGCILHHKYHIPHVMHLREFGQEDFNCWVYRWNYYKYISVESDIVLAVSHAVLDSWRKKGVWKKKSRVLYDGVDCQNIMTRSKADKEDGPLKIVMVGGICETKGQHIAIEALNALPKNLKEKVSLDIVGWYDPVYLEDLKVRIKKYQLDNSVSFLGAKDNVNDLLFNYDVGVMCSKSEGFGRVTIEYMYAGLAVIASNTGSCPELIDDGVTGYLFDRSKPEDLTQLICRIYNNRTLINELGKKANAVVKEHFLAEYNASEIEKIYVDILRENS